MSPFERVVQHLTDAGVSFTLSHHEPTLTSAEAAAARGVDAATGAKSLVLSCRSQLLLVVIPGDRQLDWKKLAAAGFRKARFAEPDELLQATGLTKGAVPPLGNLFGLPVFMDRALTVLPLVRFNAGSLTDSAELPGDRLAALCDATVGDYAR